MSEPCAYVSQTWGVHDYRWVEALVDLGFDVQIFSCEKDGSTIQQIRSELAHTAGPVLAGPLTTISHHLIGISRPLVGLSWGFDLFQLQSDGEDLSWLQQLDGLIVDSTATRNIALESGVEDAKVHSIPWGIDVETFTPQGPVVDLHEWGVPASAPIIVSLRALEPLYRVGDIIDAFALIAGEESGSHLIIGNDGSLRQELVERVQGHGISDRTTFIGRLAESDLPNLLRASTVYVTASEVDGASVTLLQAMSCEVPVVASATPGNSDWVVPGQTGHLFTMGSPQEMAVALSAAMNDSAHGDPRGLTTKARDLVKQRAAWNRNRRALGTIMRPAQRGTSSRSAAASRLQG